MPEQNFQNRTFCHGENLDFLRGLNSETIDLIATDPPFQKGPDFGTTPDSVDSKSKFKDRWIWNVNDLDGTDVRESWIDQIIDNQPDINKIIEAAKVGWGNDAAAYLCYMAVRLLEMHRVLKRSGSMYLHCNSEISHYLKLVMDVIFGNKNFQNEIFLGHDSGKPSRVKKPLRYDLENSNVVCNVVLFYVKDSGSYSELSNKLFVSNKSLRDDFIKTWDDIPSLPSSGKILQKPLVFYKRMIEISTNPGDMVLDPFSGYGTTLVAAELLDRQWIGIDLWERSGDILLERLKICIKDFNEKEVIYLDKTLGRTDLSDDSSLIYYGYKRKLEPWERLSRHRIRQILGKIQESEDEEKIICAGCGRCLEMPFMTLDHINPKSAGGRNSIENRVLICQPCNGNKDDKYTFPGLWNHNQVDGWMMDFDKAYKVHQKVLEKIEEIKDNRF